MLEFSALFAQNFLGRKRPRDMRRERTVEHKRWRSAIDVYAQYTEWVQKVNEVGDMPDVESSEGSLLTESVADTDADYFCAVDPREDIFEQVPFYVLHSSFAESCFFIFAK